LRQSSLRVWSVFLRLYHKQMHSLKWISACVVISAFSGILMLCLPATYESYSFQRSWREKTWFGTQAVFRDGNGIFSLRTIHGGVKPPFFLKEKQLVTPSDSETEHLRTGNTEYFYIQSGKVVKTTQNFCVVESRENQIVRQIPCPDGIEQKRSTTVQFSNWEENRNTASSSLNSYNLTEVSARDQWTFLTHRKFEESLPPKSADFLSSFLMLHSHVLSFERNLKLCKIIFETCPSLEHGLQEARRDRATAWDNFEPGSP
jgi:hypothetical protein